MEEEEKRDYWQDIDAPLLIQILKWLAPHQLTDLARNPPCKHWLRVINSNELVSKIYAEWLGGPKAKGDLRRYISEAAAYYRLLPDAIPQRSWFAGLFIGQSPVSSKDFKKVCFYCTQRGHHIFLEYTLQRCPGEDVDFQYPTHGGLTLSPLLTATKEGFDKCTALLLAYGASPDETRMKDGQSALYVAAEKGYSSIVTQLLAYNSNVDLRSRDGATALYAACRNGKQDICDLLVTAGASKEVEVARTHYVISRRECGWIVRIV